MSRCFKKTEYVFRVVKGIDRIQAMHDRSERVLVFTYDDGLRLAVYPEAARRDPMIGDIHIFDLSGTLIRIGDKKTFDEEYQVCIASSGAPSADGAACAAEPEPPKKDLLTLPDHQPPDPGCGYRFLEPGEVLRKGDEFWNLTGAWRETGHVGSVVCERASTRWWYRRKLESQPIPVPEGYYELPRCEKVQPGDLVCSKHKAESWSSIWSAGSCFEQHSDSRYVRKCPDPGPGYRLLKPEEIVKNGDEWCYPLATGVWREATLSGTIRVGRRADNGFRSYSPGFVRRKLEKVWGLDEFPGLEPGRRYRFLLEGETVQENDEVYLGDRWWLSCSVGEVLRSEKSKAANKPYRRLIE